MIIPSDYAERVYAGVLGKLIGVYLGRPFEGWGHTDIEKKLGQINYYVHQKLDLPLIVTDDDIAGTFTFLRALSDYGNSADITSAHIGQTWLNYLIEGRTVLWWGGMGNSTEHTAYLRLKNGVIAPQSGSAELNGRIVAEQIGAQIFIDGWAMVSPGDPEQAADFARRASGVSHDGEAIYAAQVIAAMEAQAFVEPDLYRLIETGLRFIPKGSIIARLINDLCEWRTQESSWREARLRLAAKYGYAKYGGGCHVVPNHGLILLSLLYGDDDFQKTLMIVNTSGWDTDCNSGNVGCLMGIKGGLAGLETGPDWRGPIADRLYLSTADGGRAITDAATEALYIVNSGRALLGLGQVQPKQGARFHFELPGSVQGWQAENSLDCERTSWVENVAGYSSSGQRSLAWHYHNVSTAQLARIATSTFIPLEALSMPGYSLLASPTLYSGQTIKLRLQSDKADKTAILCRLYIGVYDENDKIIRRYGPELSLEPGAVENLEWIAPDNGGQPIAEIGLELSSARRAGGTVYLDYLTWDGTPKLWLGRPQEGGKLWQKAWVAALFNLEGTENWHPEPYRLIQNTGRGFIIQGSREWRDYTVSTTMLPHLAKKAGIAVRVQGLKRYYALLLGSNGTLSLIKELDGEQVLAEKDFEWRLGQTYNLELSTCGNALKARLDGLDLFEVEDRQSPLDGGGIALICEEGRVDFGPVRLNPVAFN